MVNFLIFIFIYVCLVYIFDFQPAILVEALSACILPPEINILCFDSRCVSLSSSLSEFQPPSLHPRFIRVEGEKVV